MIESDAAWAMLKGILRDEAERDFESFIRECRAALRDSQHPWRSLTQTALNQPARDQAELERFKREGPAR